MDSTNFDVVIIGAGIGGLICGCFLAKKGLRVKILEKNGICGGCCTTFKRQGHLFDAFAHSIGGLGENGVLSQTLNELGISWKSQVKQSRLVDTVYCQNRVIKFWRDRERTIEELSSMFPQDSAGIRNFYEYFRSVNLNKKSYLLKCTLADFIEEFKLSLELRNILDVLIYGNGGLPTRSISTFVGLKIIKDFILDGGYYPVGGVQSFTDMLSNRFLSLGGDLSVSAPVEKVENINKSNKLIFGKNGQDFKSKKIVFNCDLSSALSMCGISESYRKIIIPGTSVFINYYGLDDSVEFSEDFESTVWMVNSMLPIDSEKTLSWGGWFSAYKAPDLRGVCVASLARYGSKEYWIANRNSYSMEMEEGFFKLFPQFINNIKFRFSVDPVTFANWTSNTDGAVYGMEKSPEVVFNFELKKYLQELGCFISSHWAGGYFGVSGVASLGAEVASSVVKDM